MRSISRFATGFIALASFGPALAQDAAKIEYRDGSEASSAPIVDVSPVIPMNFVSAADHFSVVSQSASDQQRNRYKASRFKIDEEMFEMLVSGSTLTVSTQPWHPVRDGAIDKESFVPKLVRCNYSKADIFGCNIYPNRSGISHVRATNLLGGGTGLSLTVKLDDYIVANSIQLDTTASVRFTAGDFSETKDYSLGIGMIFPTRPALNWEDGDSKRILNALSSGEDIMVSFADKKGEEHSFEISSRDFRIGFLMLKQIWPELHAKNNRVKGVAAPSR